MADLIRREHEYVPGPAMRLDRSRPNPGLNEDDGVDIRRYYQVLVKRRWLIIAVVMTVIAVVALQSFTTTPLYRSSVKIQIDPDSSNIVPYKDFNEASAEYRGSETYLQTQLEVLKSRALARRVVDRLNLPNDPRFNAPISTGFITTQLNWVRTELTGLFSGSGSEKGATAGTAKADAEQTVAAPGTWAAIDKLQSGMDINQIPNSRLVEISWSGSDPELTAVVVDAIAEEFIEQNLRTRYEATARATEFLKEQLQEIKSKVEKSEAELVKYARENNILNITDRESISQQTLSDLNRQVTEVQGTLISESARFQAVRNATVDNFPQVLRSPTIQTLEERLFGLEQNLASLSAQFGAEWPAVVQAREQITEVKQQLAKEKREAIQRARMEYQMVIDRDRMLQGAFNRQKSQVNKMNEDSIQYNILQREVDTNKQLYDGLLQRLKEAGVSAGLRTSPIHIVDHGRVPTAPFLPRKAADLAFALGIGLLLAIGLAFLMEYMDNTLKTPDEVEASIGLPSLGVIPTIAKPGRTQKFLAAKNSEEDENSTALLNANELRFRVWESYRSLRTSILLSNSGKPPRTILVTSSIPGEGKTTTVANIGIVLAQTGARTLLVDLDMRKPALDDKFNCRGEKGMSSYLSGNSDLSSLIRPTAYPNLFILPAGFRPPNPAELIGSDKMETGLKLLGEYFKYVVVDSPPVLAVTDALVISPLVDGVVLVVRGGATPKDVVRKAGGHLVGVHARILGAVINNVNMDAPEYVHYYRHYYDETYSNDFSAA